MKGHSAQLKTTQILVAPSRSTMLKHFVILVVFASALFSVCDGLRVVGPPSAAESLGNLTSPALPQFLASFDVVGPIDLILETQPITANSCVLVFPKTGIPPDVGIRKIFFKGAKCVVAVSFIKEAGTGKYFRDMSDDVSMVQIPVVEVSQTSGEHLKQYLEKNGTLSIVVTDSENSVWEYVLEGGLGLGLGIAVGVHSIINILIGIYKTQAHLRLYGCKPSIAQTVFWIDIVANFLRLWFNLISQNFRRQILYAFSTMCSSLSWPLNIITLLLVGIKWHELTSANNVKQSLFLSAHRRPFLIVSGAIFILELLSSLIRGLFYPITLLAGISWALLCITSIVVTILLWIFGARVLAHLKKVRQSGAASMDSRMVAMKRATMGMMAAGVGMIIVSLAFIIFLILQFSIRESVGLTIAYVPIALTGLNIASTLQLLSFPTPSKSRSDLGETISRKSSIVSRSSASRSTETYV